METEIMSPLAQSTHDLIELCGLQGDWPERRSWRGLELVVGALVTRWTLKKRAGGGARAPTWRNLLDVIKTAGLPGLAKQIAAFLKGACTYVFIYMFVRTYVCHFYVPLTFCVSSLLHERPGSTSLAIPSHFDISAVVVLKCTPGQF